MENEKNKKRLHTMLRYASFALIGVFFCLVEKSWFSLDVGASPFFVAAFCAAVGYYTDIISGMTFGMVLGLIADAMGGSSIYILPVLYLLYGMLAGVLGEHMYRTRPLSAVVPLGVVTALHALYRSFVLMIGSGFSLSGLGASFASLGITLLLTLLLGLPLFLSVRLIAKERSVRKVHGGKNKHIRRGS